MSAPTAPGPSASYPGPVFTQLLMADEINRASPRTQSALLQSMQEHHVTVAGVRHDLPAPFHVLATQNPLEQEGTYPLPEAQLDRFLLQIDVLYPDRDAERRMLFETTGSTEASAEQVLDGDGVRGHPAAGARHAGRRIGGRGDPQPRPLGAPGQRRRQARRGDRLGPGPPRQPVADAGGAGPRPDRRPLRAVARRRQRPRRAGAQAPHGALLRRARRRA